MRHLLLLLFLPTLLLSQTISITPDRYLADHRGGVLPTPVFTINKKDTSLFPPGRMPQFRLPKSKGPSGFAFMPCPFVPEHYGLAWRVPVYFTHLGEPGMQAFVDRNFNGDYTDDGAASPADESGRITVALADPAHPGTELRMRYRMLTSLVKPDSALVRLFDGNAYYTGVNFKDPSLWLVAEPLLIKGRDVVIGSDSMCVAFFDQGADGCFTGTGDLVALLPYGSDSAYTTPSRGMRILAPGLLLGFRGKTYEIDYDSTQCAAATLRARPDLPPPSELVAGDALPHFYVRFFSGDSADIYTSMRAGTYLYLDFWGTWCGTCRMQIPALQALHDTLGDRLTIVSLDAYDEPEKVKAFVAEKQMCWVQGYSNLAAMRLLYGNDTYPYGVLVDPQGKIVAFDVQPKQVAEIISGR